MDVARWEEEGHGDQVLSMDIDRSLIKWSIPYLNLVRAPEIRKLGERAWRRNNARRDLRSTVLRVFESLSRLCRVPGRKYRTARDTDLYRELPRALTTTGAERRVLFSRNVHETSCRESPETRDNNL